MAIILTGGNRLFVPQRYANEKDFERDVVRHAQQIFGPSALYFDVKRRVTGNQIVSIPDGYVIDLADPSDPKLFVVENEIASHDAFKHIGIQLLRFVTSFEGAQRAVRAFLMDEIARDQRMLSRMQEAVHGSGCRNVDELLDRAVYSDFRGVVVIDEASEELHQVLRRIAADISVLEFKAFVAEGDERLFQFDTLYDELEEGGEGEGEGPAIARPEIRAARRERRARADTVVVPAREEGFQEVFLGANEWYQIRIGAAIKPQLKYIAAYRVAPISAVTHIAEIKAIEPYKSTGKYRVLFKGPAQEIKHIAVRDGKNAPQGPVYVKHDELVGAVNLEEALKTK